MLHTVRQIHLKRIMKRIFTKGFAFLLAAVFLLPLFPAFTVRAAESGESSSSERYGVPSRYYKDGKTVLTAEDWRASGDTGSSIVASEAGAAFRIYSGTGNAKAFGSLGGIRKLEGAKELGVYITSMSMNSCTVTLTVTCDTGTSSVTAGLPSAEEFYIFVPVPKKAMYIYDVSVSVTPTENDETESKAVSAMIREAVLSATDHTEFTDTYSAFAVEGVGDGGAVSDTVPVTGAPVITSADGESYAAIVTLSGGGGGITLHTAGGGEDYSVAGSSVITKGRTSYVFRVEKLYRDSEYKLEFTGTEKYNVKLEGIRFIAIESFDKDESLGTISKCTYSNGTVEITGSITRDAAVKYIKGDLLLYEIPLWDSTANINLKKPKMAIEMSTSFSFSIPVSEDHSALVAYAVAIKSESGIFHLSDPVYPALTEIPEAETGTFSVSGIRPEEAFTYGFDSFVLTVDLSQLFLEKSGQNTTLFTYDGEAYYLNKDILSSVDKKARFLSSAGIGTVFRLTSSEGGISNKNEDELRKVAAAAAYIHRTYDPMRFIMDLPIMAVRLSDSAYGTAAVIRMIFAAAEGEVPVIVPADTVKDTETFAWLLSEYMSSFPKTGWEFLIGGLESPKDIAGSAAEGIMASAVDGGAAAQFTLSLPLDKKTPLSYSDMLTDRTGISYVMEGESGDLPNIPEGIRTEYAVFDNASIEGSCVTLWDFTESYDSAGFTVSEGATAIFTGTDNALENHTGIPACRALKTVLTASSGVIMANPVYPLDLSDYSMVKLLFSAEADSPVKLGIVFISGKKQAVFNYEITGSGVYSPVCDLSKTDISGKIDRIAIVLESGDALPISIASVTAFGGDGNGDIYIMETTAAGDVQTTPADVVKNLPWEIIAATACIILTAIVFVLLTKRKS